MRGIGGKLALLCLLAAATPQAANASWNEAKSKHFIVYSNGGANQVQDFTEKLEKFDYLLRTITGTKDDDDARPVKVYALDQTDQVQALVHNNAVAGFYSTTGRNGFAVVTRKSAAGQFDLDAQQILFHEYAHHFMLHYFPAAYPAWYVEGFAEFFSTVGFKEDGAIIFGKIPLYRAPALVVGGLYPLQNLFTRDTDKLTQKDGDRYYATAWLLTHYFRYNEARRAEFAHYLTDMVNGKADVTLDGYFQGGGKALERELRLYMGKRMAATSLTPTELPRTPVTVSTMDAARSDLVMNELRLMTGAPKAQRERQAEAVRTIAAKYPASAYAQSILADAEMAAGNKDAALAAADRAIAIDPHYAEALATRGSILLEKAQASDKAEDWKAALSSIVKANRADVRDPVPLMLFFRYHQLRGGEMPQVAYDGLDRAFTLLPQNPGYRFMLASALAHRKDYKNAIAIMGPLAFSPHASVMREAALKMQDRFRQAEKDGGVVALEVDVPNETDED